MGKNCKQEELVSPDPDLMNDTIDRRHIELDFSLPVGQTWKNNEHDLRTPTEMICLTAIDRVQNKMFSASLIGGE